MIRTDAQREYQLSFTVVELKPLQVTSQPVELYRPGHV